MKRRHVVVFAACALALAVAPTGCVSKGKYAALQKQLDETRATLTGQLDDRGRQLGEKDGRIKELETAIQAKDQEIAQAREKDTTSQGEIQRLEGERARLEAELAAVVRDRAQLKASATEMQEALADSNRRKAEAEKRVSEYKRLIAQFKNMIDAGKLKVKIVDGRMVLALATDVLFASGSADLSDVGLKTVAELTNVLVTIPDRRFQIEGHTDNVPIHTTRFPSNWELAAARAVTVANTMIAVGMSPGRLSAASYGEFRPAAGNDTAQGKAANRRIEIVVVPDLSQLPGFEELKHAVEGD